MSRGDGVGGLCYYVSMDIFCFWFWFENDFELFYVVNILVMMVYFNGLESVEEIVECYVCYLCFWDFGEVCFFVIEDEVGEFVGLIVFWYMDW